MNENLEKNLNNLPNELRKTGLFCSWRDDDRYGPLRKLPYSPITNKAFFDCTKKEAFATFQTAVDCMKQHSDNGIGVGIFDNLGAIEIDQCFDEKNNMSEDAARIMDKMQAYTERSAKGSGLRILFKATGFKLDTNLYNTANPDIGLEIYLPGYTNKFATVTGDVILNRINLEERGEKLQEILDMYLRKTGTEAETIIASVSAQESDAAGSERIETNSDLVCISAADDTGEAGTDVDTVPGVSGNISNAVSDQNVLSDAELIEKAKNARNGYIFEALFNGDLSQAGGDYYKAVEMFCCDLAFWTAKNAARMDQIFRISGLMDASWDAPATSGKGTLGENMIRNAISLTRNVYCPKKGPGKKSPRTSPAKKRPKIKADDITIYTPNGPRILSAMNPENEHINPRYEHNDIGIANLFADCYRGKILYVPERNRWYVYDGKRWKPDEGKVMELVKRLVEALKEYTCLLRAGDNDYIKYVQKLLSRRKRETILKDAESIYTVSMSEFDKDPYLLNCLNGTLDLRTFELHDHTPEDMLTKISGVAFDKTACCDRWKQHMIEIMDNDMGKVEYLQKALGYALTGSTNYECFFICYGPTSRNGKGVTMETFMTLIGDYGKSARPETIERKQVVNSSGPNEDIARLSGARFVNISEPEKNLVLSTALIKTLTGNDSITARFLHENSFEFLPAFKIFINTNYLPKVTDTTLFSSERVKVIPFEHHFDEMHQDKELKWKLRKPENLSGILNWCLEGLRLLRDNGFTPPPAVREAISQYEEDSNKIGRFISEYTEQDVNSEIRTEDAYSVYRRWCTQNGLHEESAPTFKEALKKYAVVRRTRPRNSSMGTNPLWLIQGIRWKKTLNYTNYCGTVAGL